MALTIRDLLPVPPERWPTPVSRRVLADCGKPSDPSGQIVDDTYEGQEGSWPLYMQLDHAVSLAVYAFHGGNWYVRLARQWRPVDTKCWELPAGRMALSDLLDEPDQDWAIRQLLERIMAEALEEVGELTIQRGFIGRGVSHDVGREISGMGGPKLFVPFCVVAEGLTPEVTFTDWDEQVHSAFYPVSHVIDMMTQGFIHDPITLLFLPHTFQRVTGETDPFSGAAFHWHDLETETIASALAAAKAKKSC